MIIVEEIKMNLLAKSCFAPGLIAMISNLIASAGKTDTTKYEIEWLKEYTEGMGHEIYRVKIEQERYLDHLTFQQVATICHEQFRAVVFAMEIEPKNFQG